MADTSHLREYDTPLRAILADPAKRERMREIVRGGGGPGAIAEEFDLDRHTVTGWLNRAKKPGPNATLYLEFRRLYRAAESFWERGQNAKIDAIADGTDPRKGPELSAALTALKWRLEKRLPKTYGNRQRVEHTGAKGGPVAVTVTDDHDLLARVQAAATRRRGGPGRGGIPGASGG